VNAHRQKAGEWPNRNAGEVTGGPGEAHDIQNNFQT